MEGSPGVLPLAASESGRGCACGLQSRGGGGRRNCLNVGVGDIKLIIKIKNISLLNP